MEKAIIFSAPSASGKTTIVHRLMKLGLPLGFSISATSREPRKHERDGEDYFFLTAEEFRAKIDAGDFLEWEEVYENVYYGTLKSECRRIWDEGMAIMFDVDVKGGVRLKEILGDKALSVFIKAPSMKALEQRLRDRKTETEESIQKRLERAGFEMSFESKFDSVIINDDLEEAIHEAEQAIIDFL
ncbi:MAG: guanylate kinase [Marinilabiliales bacterium]|nr:MAG: guanylate kinase [Marinilabiliales bacterium]